jgi:hypothetical protein
MPAKSKKQQQFMGMVRAAQKGELENPSEEVTEAAEEMSEQAVKEFAETKHEGLPAQKEAAYVGYSTGYMSKEANKGKILQAVLGAFKNPSGAGGFIGTSAAGAAAGAAATPAEAKFIEHHTDSDLRPGARLALTYGNMTKGAILANPRLRSLVMGPTKGKLTSKGGTTLDLKGARPWKNLMYPAGAIGTPGVAAYGVHKAWPYDMNATATNWANVIEDPAGTMAKKVPEAIDAHIKRDPKLSRAVDAIKNDPDPAGTFAGTIIDKILDRGAQYAPDFAKSVGTSAGLGAVGGGVGWLMGDKIGDVFYRDTHTVPYEERRSRERKRTAIKVLMTSLGSAGMVMAAASPQAQDALNNISSKLSSPKKEKPNE